MEVKRGKTLRVATIIAIAITGTITPFVDYLVIVEIFFLAIPLLLLLFVSLVYLTRQLYFRKQNTTNGIFLACLIPTFLGCQVVATYAVDKVQRFRADRIIKQIEMGHSFPKDHETLGIKIKRDVRSNSVRVSYSRGFSTTEVYDDSLKTWESFGWND
jgi:hypothetical protein